jgi:O-antigen/teichoic acid export membrane protein
VADRAETVFLASVALGAALWGIVAALGPLAALFFDEPELSWLFGLLGLNFLLRGLGSTHYALAEKRLDFRARTLAELADVVVRASWPSRWRSPVWVPRRS